MDTLHIGTFELQGEHRTISNSMGFPQGSVASAKLWILAFNEAIEIINSGGIYGVGFADDCCALVGGTNLGYMVQKIQTMLDKLINWGKTAGLEFNEEKMVVIHFTRTKVMPKHHLIMNGKKVPYSHCLLYTSPSPRD